MQEIIRYDTLYSNPNHLFLIMCGKPESVRSLEYVVHETVDFFNKRNTSKNGKKLTASQLDLDPKDFSDRSPMPHEPFSLSAYRMDLDGLLMEGLKATYSVLKTEFDYRIPEKISQADLKNTLPVTGPFIEDVVNRDNHTVQREHFKSLFEGMPDSMYEEVIHYLVALLHESFGNTPRGRYVFMRTDGIYSGTHTFK